MFLRYSDTAWDDRVQTYGQGVEFVEPLPLCSSCPCDDRGLCPPFRRVHGRVS